MKLRETLSKLLRWLEKGYALDAYTELYTYGAIDLEEYLEQIWRIEEE